MWWRFPIPFFPRILIFSSYLGNSNAVPKWIGKDKKLSNCWSRLHSNNILQMRNQSNWPWLTVLLLMKRCKRFSTLELRLTLKFSSAAKWTFRPLYLCIRSRWNNHSLWVLISNIPHCPRLAEWTERSITKTLLLVAEEGKSLQAL